MLTDYLTDLQNGVGYGIDRALEFTTQDPQFHSDKPEDIYHQKVFIVAERLGEVGGAILVFPFVDLCTLGILPLYNYLKYRKRNLE